jgi:hypothetical protein
MPREAAEKTLSLTGCCPADASSIIAGARASNVLH